MVDELRAHHSRTRTLSDSSRSDVATYSGSDSSETAGNGGCSLSPRQNQCNRSRKQNIRELREEFDDYPELYGIRRSARSRKEPFRFRPLVTNSGELENKRRVISNSSSSHDRSSGSESGDCWDQQTNRRYRAGRTRGNRVNYKSAFADESLDDSDDNTCERSGAIHTRQLTFHSQSSQQSSFQKPKGPLVRKLNSASLSSRLPCSTKSAFQSTEQNELTLQASEEEDADNVYQTAEWSEEEEADVIEEVLTHSVRRKGATGNPTTMYNTKLEKDLNACFDPATEPGELQFLIKWRNWSHIHSTWETEASLRDPDRGCPVYGFKKLLAYQAMLRDREERIRHAEREDLETFAYEEEREEQILEDKMNVERIVAHSRDPVSSTFDYLIKWFRLDYRYCSWESGKVIRALYLPAVKSYEARCQSTTLPNRKCEFLCSRPKFNPLSEQPVFLGNSNDCRLRDYQLEGINWIARAWCRGNSVILADEMGLGKTIQTIGFLSYLFHEHSIFGPFLIVVPLSTISSWQKELQAWAPQLNAIMYTGDHISRQLIREHEWSVNGSGGNKRHQALKFNVCVTTYEILLKDKYWLGQVSWCFLGVDEAHRLKNDSSQLYKTLKTFDTNTRLLITGTPLQNTMRELWALLHFIMPEKFPNWEDFEQSYSMTDTDSANKNDGETFHNLHKVLRPFLLRRVKKDVESSLPEKIEQILRVDMTKEQANIYRLILARNYDGLMKVTRGHRASFINIVMELKKCCNHAHLIAPPQDFILDKMTGEEYLLCLIRGSGKMTLLDKLLQRLKSKGHRVLIFSQMVRMLDLIARYLTLRGWGFQRLDGSIRGALRRQALDHFNADGSTDFCFLLSTRAGGLGINLATADTVIIFDSDWNPQNDLQAQARAHRIGQTKQVSVYRLVTRDSVEEKIIESATRKMVLDHLVIQRMDSTGGRNVTCRKGDTAKGQLLTEILRYGAEGLFKQGSEDVGELEVDIDDILNRAETRDTEATAECNPANALLSSFKVAALDAPDEEPDNQPHNGESSKGWDEIIPSELRGQLKAEEIQKTLVDLELGPRRRKQVKTFQAGLDPNSPSTATSEDEGSKIDSSQLSEKEVRALVRAIKRFARPLERIDAIAADAELPDRSESELRCFVDTILKGCQAAIQSAALNSDDHQKSGGKGPVFQYGRVSIAAKPLLQSLEYLEILHQCLPMGSKEARMAFELPFLPKSVAWSCSWDASDDVRLLTGVYEHGYDNWEAVKLDSDLGLGSKLLPVLASERPQASHIRSRVDYLLKMLAKYRHHEIQHCSLDGPSGKKRKRRDVDNLRSEPKLKLRPEFQKKHKNIPKDVRQAEVGANVIQPKSAEFVETDDSSSDSVDEEGLKSQGSAGAKKSKPDASGAHDRDHSSNEPMSTTPLKRDELSSRHVKSDEISSFSVPITREEEGDFRNMRGPLFLKCKEKLLPIKKHFKHLENLEDAPAEDPRQFAKVILRIGDHIHSLVRDVSDKDAQHLWKGYLWNFVQIFSKKSTDELRRIYRRAVKRRHKVSDSSRDSHSEDLKRTANDGVSEVTKNCVHASWSHNHRIHRTEASRFSGSDSRYAFFHRDKLRNRNDSRFDNAFNRPPTSFGFRQNYTSSRTYSIGSSHLYHMNDPYPSPHLPSVSRLSLPTAASSIFPRPDTAVPPTNRPVDFPMPPTAVAPNIPVDSAEVGVDSPFKYSLLSSRDPRLAAVRR